MIQERTNHKKVNVYAAIGIFGRVTLHVFHEKSDSKIRIKILQTHLIPKANRIYNEFGYEWVLVEDNVKYHKSKMVNNFFFENDVKALHFPPYSPDLNPIENLCALLKHNVGKRGPVPLKNWRDLFMKSGIYSLMKS